MGKCETFGGEREPLRTERQIARFFLESAYTRVDRAWRTVQLASDQVDRCTGRDQFAQLRYLSWSPGAARRPWSLSFFQNPIS